MHNLFFFKQRQCSTNDAGLILGINNNIEGLYIFSMMGTDEKRKAIFLDRDGVVNEDHGYTYLEDDFEFLDGVFPACRRFMALGYRLVVVTNQSGIARGYYNESDFEKITDFMLTEFKEQGVHIDAVYHCPHHAKEGYGEFKVECDCRKPKPGMLLKAAKELNLNLSESIMIGDKISDMIAGKAAGVKKCILISGASGHVDGELADSVASSLMHVRL